MAVQRVLASSMALFVPSLLPKLRLSRGVVTKRPNCFRAVLDHGGRPAVSPAPLNPGKSRRDWDNLIDGEPLAVVAPVPSDEPESLPTVRDIVKEIEAKKEKSGKGLNQSAIVVWTVLLAGLGLYALSLVGETPTTVPQTLEMPSENSFDLLASIQEFVDGPRFLVSLGMGLSAFIQALTGFGFAIVSVGALTQIDWIAHSSVFDAIQPVAATLGAFTGWFLILPEIRKVNFRDIAVLLVATTITTPLGALLLESLDSVVVIRGLGVLISAYVAYSVAGIRVPGFLGGAKGAWGLGFLAGALGGAFDITGPPLVVHGEAANWNSNTGEFRRNVLTVISVNSSVVVLWDYLSGRLSDFYYFDFLKYAAPSVIIGVLLGKWLAAKLDAKSFRNIVLATCMIMGIKLTLS